MNAPLAPRISSGSHASRIQRVVSRGGIEAWLVEDYTVPLVALEMLARGGAVQDPADRAGLGYFLAGMLDEGAGPYSSEEFHERLDAFAIELRFGCDRDTFSGHLRTLVKHRGEAFEMLRLALNAPRFDVEPVDRVRAQLEAGIRHEVNDPDAMVAKAWFEAAFPGHPYGRQPHGTLESLPRIGVDDLRAARSVYLARDVLKIAVVGAIDAASLAEELDRVFGDLPATARQAAIPLATPAALGERRIVDLAIPQSSIRFGAPGIARRDPEWSAALLVNHVLGGGVFSSRLFREVREKRGLAYSVYSHLSPLEHAPLIMGGTSTKNERAAESLSIIEDEIRSLAALGPTASELDLAKKYLTGSYALNFDTSTKIAGQLVRIQLEGLGIDYMDRRNDEVWAVDMERARAMAQRLYGAGKLLVAVVGRPQGM